MDFEEFTKLMNDDEEDKSVNKDELDEIVKYINDNLERCSLEEEQREKQMLETIYEIDMELKKTHIMFEYAKIIDKTQLELILGEQDNIIPDSSNTIIIKILELEHTQYFAIIPYNDNGIIVDNKDNKEINEILSQQVQNLISKQAIIDLIINGKLLIGYISVFDNPILIDYIKISTEYGEIIEYYKNNKKMQNKYYLL